MMTRPNRPLTLALLMLFALAGAARADVVDKAGFFSQDAVQQANQTLNQLRRDTGKELLIETIATAPNTVDRDRLSQSFEQFAAQKAQQDHVNGVYLLICKNSGVMTATSGNSTANGVFEKADANRLRQIMQDQFKRKDYDAGLKQGVSFVDQTVRSNGDSGRSAAGTPPVTGRNAGGGTIQKFPSQPTGSTGSPADSASGQTPDSGPGVPVRDNPKAGGSGFGTIFWIIAGAVVIGVIYFGLKLFTGRGGSGGSGGNRAANLAGAASTGGYGRTGGATGGGLGGGLMGGLLGGVAGNLLGGRLFGNRGGGQSAPSQSAPTQAGPTPPSSGGAGGTFNESSDVDTSFGGAASTGTFGDDASDAGGGFADSGGGEDFSGDNSSTGTF